MPRPVLALPAGLLFILAYVIAVLTLWERVPQQHWAVEALFWGVAGTVWVVPVRWLMLWGAGQR